MYTKKELLEITQMSPERLKWCESERITPRPEDIVWLGTKERKYYPEYAVFELMGIESYLRRWEDKKEAWQIKLRIPLKVATKNAHGSHPPVRPLKINTKN